jgi:lipopolysaccharide export system protein LptA
MMHYLIPIAIVLRMSSFTSLPANEIPGEAESMTIASEEAEYSGKDIILTGNVIIERELGKIRGDRLRISPSPGDKDVMKFALLKMDGDIVIELKKGGLLHCQKAEIDYLNFHAIFLGTDEQPDVVFTDIKKTGEVAPFIVKATEMRLDLKGGFDSAGKKSETFMTQIVADGNVRVFHNKDYIMTSDYATYECGVTSTGNQVNLLSMNIWDQEQNSCHMTNLNGDHIKALRIVLDVNRRLLTCFNSMGAISVTQATGVPRQILFSSDRLTWDEEIGVLALSAQVEIKWGELGELTTDEEVRIFRSAKDSRSSVKSLLSVGRTRLAYVDGEQNIHKLVCQGPVMVDYENGHVTLRSPVNDAGDVLPDQQVYLEGILGDVYADQIVLDRPLIDKSSSSPKITMEGNVRIFNRFDGHVGESGSVLQYTLADLVEYDPEKKEMVLSGKNGKRVLFYDKVNNIRMSAPSLKVRRDEKSPKGIVQGIGDVRFTFVKNEFDQLRQHFQFKDQAK